MILYSLLRLQKHISYFFMHFETFLIKLRLIHSAGLTIANKDVAILVCLVLLYDCLRESLNI